MASQARASQRRAVRNSSKPDAIEEALSEIRANDTAITHQFPKWAEPLWDLSYEGFVIEGGRGSTKSWTVADRLLIKACDYSNRRILCCRELQNSIAESVHHLLEEQIERLGLTHWFDIQKQAIYRKPYREVPGDKGSEFIFYGIKSNPTKIKSAEGITDCWVEEAEKVSARSWEILLPTLFRVKEHPQLFITFNPDEESDPTYQQFVINTPPNYKHITVNWQQNPWFPEGLRKQKDYMAKVDPEAYRHVWGGKCRRNSSVQIFKGKYRVDSFTVPKPDMCSESNPMWDGPYYGADWGFSQDPCVLIKFWIQWLNQTDLHAPPRFKIYIEKESWEIGLDLDLIVPRWKQDIPEVETAALILADNSRPETISHVAKRGLRVEAAEKWAGSIEDGITWLKSAEEIIIHSQCPHVLQEAQDYSYKKDRLTGAVLTDIVDANNHCWDSMRYGAQPMIMASGEGGWNANL